MELPTLSPLSVRLFGPDTRTSRFSASVPSLRETVIATEPCSVVRPARPNRSGPTVYVCVRPGRGGFGGVGRERARARGRNRETDSFAQIR